MRELSLRISPREPTTANGASLPIGITLMGLGAVLAILAAWRYHKVNLAIERGEVRADRGLVILVTVMIALLAAAMSGYMLLTSAQS